MTLHKDAHGQEIVDTDRVFMADGDPHAWGTVGGFYRGRVLVEWDARVGVYAEVDGTRLVVA